MVITAFKIGPVLVDTIHTLLDQRNVRTAGLVLVVDGCSYRESTLAICRRYARAYEGLFHYIWLDNGGVSRARNRGVSWLLERFPDIAGVFLIDGDDLLTPNSAETSLAALRQRRAEEPDAKVGWVFCDQVQFGHKPVSLKYPRRFRSSRWLASNLSQPSCLISREMFEAGVFWDESMRQGIEDWEYWHSAQEAGFVGTNNPDAYLRYRRLTGNRSSLNRAKDALTKDTMRRKHSGLLSVGRFLQDEHDDFPRWAFARSSGDWSLGSDPLGAMRSVSRRDFVEAMGYRLSQPDPDSYVLDPYFPDLLAFLDPADEAYLTRTKLLHATLFEAEKALQKDAVCFLARTAGRPGAPRGYGLKPSRLKFGAGGHPGSSFFVSVSNLIRLLDIEPESLRGGEFGNPASGTDEASRDFRNGADDGGANLASGDPESQEPTFRADGGEIGAGRARGRRKYALPALNRRLFRLRRLRRAGLSNVRPETEQAQAAALTVAPAPKENGAGPGRLNAAHELARLAVSGPGLPAAEAGSDAPAKGGFDLADGVASDLLAIAGQPKAPGKLSRPNHFYCGRDKANHRGLGNELFNIWPIMPLLKQGGMKDLALLLPAGSTKGFRRFCERFMQVEASSRFRLHVIALGALVPADMREIEESVASKGALDLDAAAWTPPRTSNYVGIPLYDRAGQNLQNDLIGRAMNMDAVVNFAGPIVSGPMLALRKSGVRTALAFDLDEDPAPFARFYPRLDARRVYSDPLAAQAYVGAYDVIEVRDENASIALQAEGVPRSSISALGFEWLSDRTS